MTSIGNPIPGVGFGILAPHLRNNFRVSFLDNEKQKFTFSDHLSIQITKVDGIEQRRMDMGHTNSCTINFQDDVTNATFKGLLALQEMDSFIVAIEMLDGANNILRTTYLHGSKLLSFGHSNLDYASGPTRITREIQIDGFIPEKWGDVTQMMNENPVAASILHALSSTRFSVGMGKNIAESAALELSAYFNCLSIDYNFDQRKAD